MKAILPAFLAALLVTNLAHAIPQTVGNGIFGAAGMAFEKYAASAGPWAQGAELKGPWKVRAEKKGDVENLDLAAEALVFGIPASQISAERSAGIVRRITVRFDEGKMKNAKANPGGLYAQVIANITLPKPDLNDRKSWPTKESFSHSSLITGYNLARREVIFTESWGERVRNRRMRIEEMEGTSYMAYYPHL